MIGKEEIVAIGGIIIALLGWYSKHIPVLKQEKRSDFELATHTYIEQVEKLSLKVDDLRAEVKDQMEINATLRRENAEVFEQNIELRKNEAVYEIRIKELEARVSELELQLKLKGD